MEMRYCMRCGARLGTRVHPEEGPVPYCESCGDYRFPVFSAAVSMVVFDREEKRMILIRQYGEKDPVLTAGYVDKGETAEEAVRREVGEELGMTVTGIRYLGSHYYAPSETLMLNYAVTVAEREAKPNAEVDSWQWVPADEAAGLVKPGGLAETLLADLHGGFIHKQGIEN